MSRSYRMLADSPIDARAKKGDTVYPFLLCDYGLARDDTRVSGHEHISVTLDPGGRGTPSFTVARRDLEPLEEEAST